MHDGMSIGPADDVGTRVPVSIVCVSNNPEVLDSTLRRSIDRQLAEAPGTELIVVDSPVGRFATAGAALNEGARRARNEVVAFVHQDVYLHSLQALEQAAGALLTTPSIGVMGAIGVDHRGRVIGRIRDRVVPSGEVVRAPVDVDTFDEVLILVSRDRVQREPLADDPTLGWHAYAVEYALRMRRQGLRAVVMNIPLTHNSLTANLDGLAEAHRWVGERYPEATPAQTTCGVVYGSPGQARSAVPGRRIRGAMRWWRESMRARRVDRVAGVDVVLADIRDLVDEAARLGSCSRIRVLEAIHDEETAPPIEGLSRYGRPFSAAPFPVDDIDRAIAGRSGDELLLVVNLRPGDLAALPSLTTAPHAVGLSEHTGLWSVIGVESGRLRPLWSDRRNRPLPTLGTPLGQGAA